MVTDQATDRSRGQIILIGAIALAFIVLGVVVVFNGVLYTETISSGAPSQSGSTADVTAAEIDTSVACSLQAVEKTDQFYNESTVRENITDELDTLSEQYQNVTAHTSPTVVDLTIEDPENNVDVNATEEKINHVNVTVSYDTHNLSYEQARKNITPANSCVNQ